MKSTQNELELNELRNKLKSCIQWLPTEIFAIIREYAWRKDYLSLVNSAVSVFRTIKYETAHFVVKVPEDVFHDGSKQQFILDLLGKVKVASSQITMEFQEISELEILDYHQKQPSFFEGVYKLALKRDGAHSLWTQKAFDFSQFQNIKRLEVTGFRSIESVNLDWIGLEYLESNSCLFRHITKWNSRKDLKRLFVRDCFVSGDLPSVDDIPSVSFTGDTSENLPFSTTGNHERVVLHTPYIDVALMRTLTDVNFLGKLKHLELNAIFSVVVDDYYYSAWKDIAEVLLWNTNGLSRPSFPVFLGIEISLFSFSLSSWNHPMILPNLKKCSLNSCHDLVHFPEAPHLKELSLSDCTLLESLPCLASLRKLTIISCPKLKTIPILPKLQEKNGFA
jgi:hypothetical protein